MRKRFIVALLLCVGLVFGATTPQPSELKKVPKSEIAKLQETFKTLKKKQDTKTRDILDVDTFTFDPNTDDLYQFTYANQVMFLVTKMGQTKFVKSGDEVSVTKEKYGQTLCAFMGIYDAYSSFDSRVGINSAGGWFYLTSYPTTDLVIFDRSSHEMNENGLIFTNIEDVSFRFVISKRGQAEIHRSLSPKVKTTTEVVTPKKIPLNQWVYIQGKQKGLMHTVGWKTANDESIASKDFERASADLQVIPMKSAFMHEVYTKQSDNPIQDKRESITYPPDLIAPNAPAGATYEKLDDPYTKAPDLNCTTQVFRTNFIYPNSPQPIRVHEFFYQPLMEMFALMDNYDALDKDMAQTIYVFNLDTNLLIELINATTGNSEAFRFVNIVKNGAIIAQENVDVYVDSADNAVVFDLRNVLPY